MNVLTVSHLRAYYVTQAFGIQREVRAVDDVSLSVARNEIYGLAGEFELRQVYPDQDDCRCGAPAAARRRR